MNINPTNVSTAAVDNARAYQGTAVEEQRPHLTLQPENVNPVETKEEASALEPEEVEEIVEALNDNMDELQTSLGFQVDEKIDQIVVTVMNRDTREIIRQIPAEELVTIREKMAELTGILLNKLI